MVRHEEPAGRVTERGDIEIVALDAHVAKLAAGDLPVLVSGSQDQDDAFLGDVGGR